MTVEMAGELTDYACVPTGVRVPLLDYDENGTAHQFMLVGLPTATGPIVNDVRGTRQKRKSQRE